MRRKEEWVSFWAARWKCKERAGSWKHQVAHLLNQVAMCHNNHRRWYKYCSYGLGMRLMQCVILLCKLCALLCIFLCYQHISQSRMRTFSFLFFFFFLSFSLCPPLPFSLSSLSLSFPSLHPSLLWFSVVPKKFMVELKIELYHMSTFSSASYVIWAW